MTSLLRVAANTQDFSSVGPGFEGFLVMFLLALATLLLVRSMVGHLRKVRYGPGPPGVEPSERDDERDQASGASPRRGGPPSSPTA